ncbi:MAG: hypothetical protein ABL901_18135 [Hyphomicrobiaceae bacterium]
MLVSETAKIEKARRADELQKKTEDELKQIPFYSFTKTDDSLSQEDEDKNWGEMSSMRGDVWTYIKELLAEAIEGEKGRAKGHLRNLPLTSPYEVIIKLFDYGWFGDKESDYALEMAELYMRHPRPSTRP